MYMKGLQGYPTSLTPDLVAMAAHEFYHGCIEEAMGLRAFVYQVMGGHVGGGGNSP